MQLHNVKRTNANKRSVRVGRGGKRGKTSGRGTKGQLARSGRKLRPELRDIIKKLPKLRGRGKNSLHSFAMRAIPINLVTLEQHFENGDNVSPAELLAKALISVPMGKASLVKVLGTGELTKKITVSGCLVSETAKAKIEKAGGSVIL